MRVRASHSPLTSSPAALWRNSEGAVLIYVTIIASVLMGMVGLAIDSSRLFTTNTQAQSAADAAALAAATQLDGRPDSITRATNAAQTTPLVQNTHSFATEAPVITIAQVRFLKSLPPALDPI